MLIDHILCFTDWYIVVQIMASVNLILSLLGVGGLYIICFVRRNNCPLVFGIISMFFCSKSIMFNGQGFVNTSMNQLSHFASPLQLQQEVLMLYVKFSHVIFVHGLRNVDKFEIFEALW